jgi:DnaJ-class molecular chaperone
VIYDDEEDDGTCPQCAGEGYILLSEAGPSEWQEDCFVDVDRDIKCPTCKGKGFIGNAKRMGL